MSGERQEAGRRESAIIVPVPAVEPLAQPLRLRYDPAAARGVPAHITLLYPFRAPECIDAAVLAELDAIFAASAPFRFRLRGFGRFATVLYLEPEPAEPFIALTRSLAQRFPDTPPYRGVHATLVPHLTLAQSDDARLLAALEPEAAALAAQLPLETVAAEALLLEERDGGWVLRERFPFGVTREAEALLAHMPAPFFSLDRDGRFTHLNAAAVALTGRTREALLGRNCWDACPQLLDGQAQADVRRTLERGEAGTFELSLAGRALDVRLFPTPGGMGALVLELGERRRAELEHEQLQQEHIVLLESAGEGIYGVDLDGRCTFVNRCALELLGYTREQLLGCNMHELAHGRRVDGTPYPVSECPLYSVFETGEGVRTGAEILWRSDGSSLSVEYSAQPILRGGRISGAVITFRDIGERLQLEAERQRIFAAEHQARLIAQEALHLRDDFLAALSHDLRTPLTAIKGLTQMGLRQARRQQSVPSAELIERLTIVERSVNSMTAMIDDLLDVSRIEAGASVALPRQPVDLVQLTRQLVTLTQREQPRYRLQFHTREEQLIGEWDAARIERVLGNLLSNALKYSPEGGLISVEVARLQREDGPWAELTVRDEGMGIPAADLPRIFARFHRGANVTGRITGLGIGLAGAKAIVELHGGSISVDSEEGRGALFSVRLPLGRANTDRERTAE